jgi:excinuclease ABC subunit C
MIEVATRRAKNLKTWGRPDLILVDGGKTQVAAFYNIFNKYNIPVVGLAKTFPSLVVINAIKKEIIFREIRLKRSSALNLLERIRDEAHRFARRYHHKLIRKYLFPVS